ncbi:glycosyltransferase family 4 protein [Flaviflexus huanghaiensis]|uniref:glycosyltransferase family 4 protein n=1 Tax=Flaviflexus huanghaiensis TaxID=1111473 RepID=UPI0015F9D374|nr:glycosyltransferase family 4 protein [Flaviflexus huanghaiensis]
MKIVIVTLDTFSTKMAGPAIRVWEMAGMLAREHDVTVLTFAEAGRTSPNFSLEATKVADFESDLGTPDVVIIQGYLVHTFPWLGERDFKLVVDLYDPFHLESLGVEKHRPMPDREHALQHAINELSAQIRIGDFFLCASETQRSLWIGHLAALGRVNPRTYDADGSLWSLIDLAPFGIAGPTPTQDRHAIKGTIPGISADDHLLIWGGGIYNWFDPLTVISAVGIAAETDPTIRLLFLGAKHPNPDVPQMAMAAHSRRHAEELGLTGTHVFFLDDWVEYGDRHNYLLDADIGVTAHFTDIETHFSFRTRVLDYLWTGLPIITSDGDFFGDLVESRGLGRTVPVGDEQAMAQAILEVLDNPDDMRARVVEASRDFSWESTLAPLLAYCRDPYYAADRIDRLAPGEMVAPRPTLRSLVSKTWESTQRAGIRHTAAKAARYLRR